MDMQGKMYIFIWGFQTVCVAHVATGLPRCAQRSGDAGDR